MRRPRRLARAALAATAIPTWNDAPPLATTPDALRFRAAPGWMPRGRRVYAIGDVLTVETKPGNTWERESKRAGKLTFRERVAEYRDQNGELVITARSVGVTTERPVERS